LTVTSENGLLWVLGRVADVTAVHVTHFEPFLFLDEVEHFAVFFSLGVKACISQAGAECSASTSPVSFIFTKATVALV
jgi:hypothetical protein